MAPVRVIGADVPAAVIFEEAPVIVVCYCGVSIIEVPGSGRRQQGFERLQ